MRRSHIAFSINGQPITLSFRGRVIKLVGDIHEAGRVFYRAKVAKPKNVEAWIIQGTKEDGYAYIACAEEYDCPSIVKAWIEDVFYQSSIAPDLPDIPRVRLRSVDEALKDIPKVNKIGKEE